MNGEAFLGVFEGDAPSGLELRHTQEFQNIVALTEPAARKNRLDGNGELNKTAAVDWFKVVSEAEKLAATGRDLRLLVIVVRAWSNSDGFAGFAAGCDLVADTLLAHWDSVHPELRDRPDKTTAAKGRENAIRDMENHENGILGDFEMSVLLEPMGIGPIRGSELAQSVLSDYEFMQIGTSGMSDAEKEERSADHARLQSRVRAAILATNEDTPDVIAGLISQIEDAERALGELETAYAKAGDFENGGGLRLGEMSAFLSKCRKAVDLAAEVEGENTGAENNQNGSVGMESDRSSPAQAAATSMQGLQGRINTRGDVEKCLDMIIEFYERTEPSSPIPHLAKRLRRMVPMDFMQLIEEVAPSGLKDFKNIAGVDDKK